LFINSLSGAWAGKDNAIFFAIHNPAILTNNKSKSLTRATADSFFLDVGIANFSQIILSDC
jgi:methionyl-tRNA synthetase